MKLQRRFAPTRGLFRSESVANFARIRKIELIEIYYKGDRENEDTERILKQYR